MDYRYWYTFLYTCPLCKKQIRTGFVVIGQSLNDFYLQDNNLTSKDLEVAKANGINVDICNVCKQKLDNHEIYDKFTCEISFYSDEEKRKINQQSFLIEKVKPM